MGIADGARAGSLVGAETEMVALIGVEGGGFVSEQARP